MNRATRILYLVAPKDDVFGLIAHPLNAAQSIIHIHTHCHKGEFLLADAQVPKELFPTSLGAHCVHTLSVALMEKLLSGSATRLNLPQQRIPFVLVPRLRHAIRQMVLEEDGMSVVGLCLHAWFWVDIQRRAERQSRGQKDQGEERHSDGHLQRMEDCL